MTHCVKVSIDADGVRIDNCACHISWDDVVSFVPSEDDPREGHITIRGGLRIWVHITSGVVDESFIGEHLDYDIWDFDGSDLSRKNLQRLGDQIDDIEFAEAIELKLRTGGSCADNLTFLGRVCTVANNLLDAANAICSAKKKHMEDLAWFGPLSETLLRNIKTQIVQVWRQYNGAVDGIVVEAIGQGLSILGTMSDGGVYVDIKSQKRSYETYFAARCYGDECNAVDALTVDNANARPFGEEDWKRERKMIVCPALTAGKGPDVSKAMEGLDIKGVMLMSAEDIEEYNDSDVGKEFPLLFAQNHPQNGKTYIQHPLQQNMYVDLEDYNRSLLEAKWQELQWLMERLGATKVTCEVEVANETSQTSHVKHQVGGHVDAAVATASGKCSREQGSSSLAKLYKKMSKTAEFNPDGHPCIPDGLVFYGGELSWQRMAESVLAGRMKHACVDFTYKKESVVSSKQMQAIGLELNSAIPGYEFGIGGDFANDFENEQRQMQSLVWHYDVTFAGVMTKGDAKAGVKAGEKRLSTRSAKKCITAKSGSRSDGEAMILGRAKRYAKTEDAAKSGLLTDAQKADLEKLASKYGVGELRLEELIDEAFM